MKLLKSENVDIDLKEDKVIISIFEDNHFVDDYVLTKEQFEQALNNYRNATNAG